jgi:hypothetical protein
MEDSASNQKAIADATADGLKVSAQQLRMQYRPWLVVRGLKVDTSDFHDSWVTVINNGKAPSTDHTRSCVVLVTLLSEPKVKTVSSKPFDVPLESLLPGEETQIPFTSSLLRDMGLPARRRDSAGFATYTRNVHCEVSYKGVLGDTWRLVFDIGIRDDGTLDENLIQQWSK